MTHNLPGFLRRVDAHYNDVTEWLSVGGDLDLAEDLTGKDCAEVIDELLAHGVTHVLDLRIEGEDAEVWEQHGLPAVNYCWAPIFDSRDYVPDAEWFDEVERFVDSFWRAAQPGDRLYVHCAMGINRGPSGAMIALLLTNPTLSPFDAFLQIRQVRPAAGVVYAKYVGIRHIIREASGWDGDTDSEVYRKIVDYTEALQTYWTPERIAAARSGNPLDSLAL